MQFPDGKFNVILADPPWHFKTRSLKGLEGRPQHYPRMSIKEICALPVSNCATDDCFLFLWTTGPHLEKAFKVISSWGFKYSGIGFTWIKLNKNVRPLKLMDIDTEEKHDFFSIKDLFMGGGYTTRKNAEFCLMAKRGHPKRISKSVFEVIISPRREHSRKPDEIYDRIEAFAKGPYLELFARTERPGWTAWGDETDKFKEMEKL